MHAIQFLNTFDAILPIIIPLKITQFTSYFKVKKPIYEEYDDQDKLKLELMVEASSWDLSSPEFSRQGQSMLDYRGWFVILNTLESRHLFIEAVNLCAAGDVMDNNNFNTVLESFVLTLLLQVVQVNTKNT